VRRVVVTGAGGKTGRAVIAALARLAVTGDASGSTVRGGGADGARVRRTGADGVAVRALVRDPSRVADLDVEVAVGDQRRVDEVAAALAGADAVYAIAPNISPHEVEMGAVLLEACRRTGTRRVVFHSVVHPQLTAMPHHADKGRVEERVIGSGLDWTILQPNAYLQNLAGQVDGLRAGTYRVPYRPDAGLALVDLHDVAEVAARCLVEDVGVHATFELSGPEEVTGHRIAEVAADLLGRPVRAERLDPTAWTRDQGAGIGEVARERLLAMFADYDRHGSPGEATVLTALLGRAPRGLRPVLAELLGVAT
jgi:NAD(P)H dehydrogenase (quinone)